MKEPLINAANAGPMNATEGKRPPRKACLITTENVLSPLAFAVLI